MEAGIKEAKNVLSELVNRARKGEEVYLTNKGERVAQIVPVAKKKKLPRKGYGAWKDFLPADWTDEDWKRSKEEVLARFEKGRP
jgi:prevent-host-death family protein